MAWNILGFAVLILLSGLHRPAICQIVDKDLKDGTPLSKFIYHYEPLNYDTGTLDVQPNARQSSHLGQSSNNTIHWEVFAFGRLFQLQLALYPSIVSQGALLTVVNLEGINTSGLVSHMYKGVIIGDRHSSAHGHIINGLFDGVLRTDGETFHIEPAFRYFNSSPSGFHSVMYRARDIHLEDHSRGNASTCQLCSVSWGGSQLSSPQKYSLNKDQVLKDTGDIFPNKLRYQRGNGDTSRKLRPIAPSNSQTGAGILSDPKQPQISQDFFSNQQEKWTSQGAQLPNENFNNSRHVPLTNHVQMAKTCVLHVVVDHTFFQHVAGGDVVVAVAEVAYHIEEANSVYRTTDFDGNGLADNVGLALGGLTIFESATAPNYFISGEYQDAEVFLMDLSLYNFSAYCMGLAFTYRDFAGGILGLAWMGYPTTREPPGGICQSQIIYRNDGRPSSLNTGMITLVNYGTYVPRSVSVTSVMHELGHGFGSPHDPQTPDCSPSGLQGNYIMYSQATDGNRPNNARFSSCSRSQMAAVIASKGALCLEALSGQYCGNGLIEQGEECDCGTPSLCALADACCTPKGGTGGDAECTFRRELGRVCSPLTSSCCDEDCHVIPASWHRHCSTDNECLAESVCNGTSADCPQPEARPNGSRCEGGAKRCLDGHCTLSACSDLGLSECFCTDFNRTGQSCQLCCQQEEDCIPAVELGLTSYDGNVIEKPPGSPCDNYSGYCDLQGLCVTIDSDSALNKLKNLFTDGKAKLYWIKKHWYYIACGALSLCFLTLSAKLSYDNRHYIQTVISRMRRFRFARERTRAVEQTGAADSHNASIITETFTGDTTTGMQFLTFDVPQQLASPSETRV